MNDPKRWSEDAGELTAAERRVFAAGQRGPEVPAAAQRAVWQGLSATLVASSAAAAGAGAGASGVTGVTTAVVIKQLAIGALLGVAVAGGGAVYERASAQRSAPSSTPVGSNAFAPATATSPTAVLRVATPSDVVPAAPSAAALERSVGSAHPATTAASARGTAAPYDSGQASFPASAVDVSDTAESRRLLAARALLRSGRASAALGALAAIRADFPEGSLVQEREALTIEALLASGDRAAARVHAAAFLQRYPDSPHGDSVRRVLR